MLIYVEVNISYLQLDFGFLWYYYIHIFRSAPGNEEKQTVSCMNNNNACATNSTPLTFSTAHPLLLSFKIFFNG